MSVQDLQTLSNKFMTRLVFSYEYKIPYSIVLDRCRRGELSVHFIDGKVRINVEEALKACVRKRQPKSVRTTPDLFA